MDAAYGWHWVDRPVTAVRDVVRDAARLPDWLELVGTAGAGDLFRQGATVDAWGPGRRAAALSLRVDRAGPHRAWITVDLDGRPCGQWYLAASPWHGGTAMELMLVPDRRRGPRGWRPSAVRRSLLRLASSVPSAGAAVPSTRGRTVHLLPRGDARPPVRI